MKHGKNVGWAPYDPDLVNWNHVPKMASADAFAAIFALPLTLLYLAVLGKSAFSAHPLQQLDVSLWWSAMIVIKTMSDGNSNPAFPKLLLFIAIMKGALIGVLWTTGKSSLALLLPSLVATLGLLSLALPPPRGPLRHQTADPANAEHYPPINVGHARGRTVGVVLLTAGLVWFVASLFDWTTPPTVAPTKWSVNWAHTFLSAIAIYALALAGSNLGSFTAIRTGWHAQTIYYRCVMPNVQAVCGPAQALGALAGLALYVTLVWMMKGAWLVPTLGAAVLAIGLAMLIARRRGLRIYPEAVRREGIFLEDDSVLPRNFGA